MQSIIKRIVMIQVCISLPIAIIFASCCGCDPLTREKSVMKSKTRFVKVVDRRHPRFQISLVVKLNSADNIAVVHCCLFPGYLNNQLFNVVEIANINLDFNYFEEILNANELGISGSSSPGFLTFMVCFDENGNEIGKMKILGNVPANRSLFEDLNKIESWIASRDSFNLQLAPAIPYQFDVGNEIFPKIELQDLGGGQETGTGQETRRQQVSETRKRD